MSELAKQLFAELGAMTRNGVREAGAELSRLGVQGGMELASALFNGNGFVPYGPGQYTPSAQIEQSQNQPHEQSHGLAQQHDRGLSR